MKFLIAGGGTGGHINPGIAIARYIRQKQKDADILFAGTQRGLETKLVPREGFELRLIKVRGFKRKLSKDTFVAIKELFQGIWEARKLIREFKPDVVIGTGGYVCGPVLFVASRMKIATLIHEQNAFPGITNRILSRFVDAVAISFKESKKFFKSARMLVHTGNPVRDEILEADRTASRQKLCLDKDTPLVVVTGGSLGAERINQVVCDMIVNHYKSSDFNIIFSTGNDQYQKILDQLGSGLPDSITITPYIYDAGSIYSAADLIICRGGAITMSELPVLGLPSVIIPSPNVTANHQEYNARALEKQGAAVVILEKDLNSNLMYQQIMSLLKDRDQLLKMARNARKMGITNATEKIYSMITEIIKKQ